MRIAFATGPEQGQESVVPVCLHDPASSGRPPFCEAIHATFVIGWLYIQMAIDSQRQYSPEEV